MGTHFIYCTNARGLSCAGAMLQDHEWLGVAGRAACRFGQLEMQHLKAGALKDEQGLRDTDACRCGDTFGMR